MANSEKLFTIQELQYLHPGVLHEGCEADHTEETYFYPLQALWADRFEEIACEVCGRDLIPFNERPAEQLPDENALD